MGRDDEEPDVRLAGVDELHAELQRALTEPDQVDALLEVAAVITKATAALGIEPVVVGGVAVGFVREGRNWNLPGTFVSLEIPDTSLDHGDETEVVTTKSGSRVRLLTLEDMVLWRVREFLHWEAVRGFHQALYLIGHPRLDRKRLERRAQEEHLTDALAELWHAKQRVDSGETIESYEIHDAAKRLNRPG